MRRCALFCVMAVLAAPGCRESEDRSEGAADRAGATVEQARDRIAAREDEAAEKQLERLENREAAAEHEADNTGVNARDRDKALPTAADQSNKPADIDLVAAIRKAVVGDEALSMAARNVKIIVRDGKVTLRGPVKDEAERRSVRTKAADLAGSGNVDDRLDVLNKPAGSQEPTMPQADHAKPPNNHR